MSKPQNHDQGEPTRDSDNEPETDRNSKAPRKPEDTDAEGNALNDVGEDNHQQK
ncbi:hypothetical protein ACO2Q2_09685 [Dyella sp. KRB-257]|uniref:hypothetical protein n=1 Tax=Dyella sp. KRB-257 TaxID=3400915 RepID=UPI003BFF020A